MQFKTPLAKAKGLGSVRHGVVHWWWQRLTAITLLPLSLYFATSFLQLPDVTYDTARSWVSAPANAVLLLIFCLAGFFHAVLGIQVIVEDYIHRYWLRQLVNILAKLLLLGFSLATLISIFRIYSMQ